MNDSTDTAIRQLVHEIANSSRLPPTWDEVEAIANRPSLRRSRLATPFAALLVVGVGLAALLFVAQGRGAEEGSPQADSATAELSSRQRPERECPKSVARGGSDTLAAIAESTRLEPMLAQVANYGADRADAFGPHGFVWHSSDDASVFASFTGDLDEHSSALKELVTHPSELIVCVASISIKDGETLQSTLMSELRGRSVAIGRGAGAVEVVLPADEEGLAAELSNRWGNALDLTVGALAYPLADASSVCESLPRENQHDALELRAAGPHNALSVSDDWFEFHITIVNRGQDALSLTSGSPRGLLLDRSGTVISARGGGIVDSVGLIVDLLPGESMDIPLFVENVSCEPSLGYTVPAGNFELVVVLPVEAASLVSPPLPVRIGE